MKHTGGGCVASKETKKGRDRKFHGLAKLLLDSSSRCPYDEEERTRWVICEQHGSLQNDADTSVSRSEAVGSKSIHRLGEQTIKLNVDHGDYNCWVLTRSPIRLVQKPIVKIPMES